VVKYRGSAHGTNEYPFLISPRGFVVLPVTSVTLNYGASDERVSTGMARLDHMLAGGLFRGSTVLVSGMAGPGKTTIGASLVDSACARGERALMVLFEESPDQFIRNMSSVGFDLRRWVDAGVLHVWAARPSALGIETHLAMLAELVDEVRPTVAVLDGITGLTNGSASVELSSVLGRKIDMLKARGVTTLATMLAHEDQSSEADVSSYMDTWLLLRNVESNGERNRLLFVIKSRGTAHSNQVREFVLTDRGIDLVDVYVGPEGVLTGSARQAQEARQRDAGLQRGEDLVRRQRDLRRTIAEGDARLIAMQDDIAGARAEMERIETQDQREMTDTEADRVAMSSRRWADSTPGHGGAQL
jgi:circadian clock protein KaiC